MLLVSNQSIKKTHKIKPIMLLKCSTFGLTFLLLFLIIFANSGQATAYIQLMMQVPFGDKIMHLTMLGSLSFLINKALNNRSINWQKSPFLLGSCCLAAVMTLEEISQIWIVSRNFEWLDLACNYTGIYLGQTLGLSLIHI